MVIELLIIYSLFIDRQGVTKKWVHECKAIVVGYLFFLIFLIYVKLKFPSLSSDVLCVLCLVICALLPSLYSFNLHTKLSHNLHTFHTTLS